MKVGQLIARLTSVLELHGDIDAELCRYECGEDDEDEVFVEVGDVIVSQYGTPKSCWISE